MIGNPGETMGVIRTTIARFSGRSLVVAILAGLFSLQGASAADSSADEKLPPPQGEIILRVVGNIDRTNVLDEAHFDRAMIEAMESHTLRTSTVVTDGVKTFEGVLMRDLLAAVGAEGESVRATALNGYVIDIPMEDFEKYDVIAAYSMDGRQLTPRDKGPLWIVYPRDDFYELQDIRYDYRWIWQLKRLEVRE